jgi:hypothetical protein
MSETPPRSDDAVEKRLTVEAVRIELGTARSVEEGAVLQVVDLDMRVAKELEIRDPAAALRRLERAETALGGIQLNRKRGDIERQAALTDKVIYRSSRAALEKPACAIFSRFAEAALL